METQLGLFESIMGLLWLHPIFFLGVVFIGGLLYGLFMKNKGLPKFRITAASILMYYYLSIMVSHIVGIPTLSEFIRLSRLGEAFFNPNINLIPMSDGLSLSFLFNIFCFIPFGFLCPVISKSYEQPGKTVLFGFGFSLAIEISQLFTLYRVSDINDLFTNVLGTVIGFLCFKLAFRLGIIKMRSNDRIFSENDKTKFIPIVILVSACVITFFEPGII